MKSKMLLRLLSMVLVASVIGLSIAAPSMTPKATPMSALEDSVAMQTTVEASTKFIEAPAVETEVELKEDAARPARSTISRLFSSGSWFNQFLKPKQKNVVPEETSQMIAEEVVVPAGDGAALPPNREAEPVVSKEQEQQLIDEENERGRRRVDDMLRPPLQGNQYWSAPNIPMQQTPGYWNTAPNRPQTSTNRPPTTTPNLGPIPGLSSPAAPNRGPSTATLNLGPYLDAPNRAPPTATPNLGSIRGLPSLAAPNRGSSAYSAASSPSNTNPAVAVDGIGSMPTPQPAYPGNNGFLNPQPTPYQNNPTPYQNDPTPYQNTPYPTPTPYRNSRPPQWIGPVPYQNTYSSWYPQTNSGNYGRKSAPTSDSASAFPNRVVVPNRRKYPNSNMQYSPYNYFSKDPQTK